jgi:hypothetical protein
MFYIYGLRLYGNRLSVAYDFIYMAYVFTVPALV